MKHLAGTERALYFSALFLSFLAIAFAAGHQVGVTNGFLIWLNSGSATVLFAAIFAAISAFGYVRGRFVMAIIPIAMTTYLSFNFYLLHSLYAPLAAICVIFAFFIAFTAGKRW